MLDQSAEQFPGESAEVGAEFPTPQLNKRKVKYAGSVGASFRVQGPSATASDIN